jgi:hypothetical protein
MVAQTIVCCMANEGVKYGFDGPGRVSGLTKTEAEDLLDYLEAHGRSGALGFDGERFSVECR